MNRRAVHLNSIASWTRDHLIPTPSSIPRPFPGGEATEKLVFNITTSGHIQPPNEEVSQIVKNWNGYNQGNDECIIKKPGRILMAFVPGSLKYTYFDTVGTTTDVTGDIRTIRSLQVAKACYMFNDIRDRCDSYRVTGASLKLVYTGNDTYNGGEICIQKFDPFDMVYSNQLTTIGDNQYLGSVPTSVSTSCKIRKFLPAKDGAQVAFFRCHDDGFHTYKSLENTNQPEGDEEAMRSMEGIILRIDRAAYDDENSSAQAQGWRWELTQTVEVSPRSQTLLATLARPSDFNNPVLENIAKETAKRCQSNGHDILSTDQPMRAMCHNTAAASAPITAAQMGSGLPATPASSQST